jgi:predicted MPP superfamily phosphohydrolase
MTVGSIAPARRRDRRVAAERASFEILLDTLFRPGSWAANLSYLLGLQGRIRTSIETVHLAVSPDGSPRSPLRVAFASDFHAGATTHPRLITDACDALAAFQPDVLLLGGDFVSAHASYVDRLTAGLGAVPAPLGKFAVLGNHDLRADSALLIERLEDVGVRILTNAHAKLPAPFDNVAICGLDDPTRGTPSAQLALDGVDATRIVLMHSPEGLRSIGERDFALALCGHTHGGQVTLPWGTALFVPGGRLNRRYCCGRFDLATGRTMIVSRGVGCSTLPVRLFAAPEVHLCLIV